MIAIIDDKEWYVPEGFPVEGNERILKLLNPIFNYLILIDKVVTCAVINALTLNIKPINDGHDYNSNFIVMPKGFGKTTLLKNILYDANVDNMIISESKHFESDLVTRDQKSDYIGKTWLNFDAISLLLTSKPVQRAQLIAFYTETLSDGLYSRKQNTVNADYNIQYVMASENFYLLQKELYNSTIFDRVVPIYFHPSEDDKEQIRKKANLNRKEHKTNKMPKVKLPYLKELHKYHTKLTFEYDDEISDKIDELSQTMSSLTAIGVTRVSRYISNFICSNALINGRARNFIVYPEMCDLDLFEWLLPIHFPLDDLSFEFAVYAAIKENVKGAMTVSEIFHHSAIQTHPIYKELQSETDCINIVTNNIRMEINKLFTRGMIEMERAGGIPIYWCKE